MKKKLFAVVVAALFIGACGGGGGGGGGDVDTDVCGGAGLGCMTGSVTDSTGTAIANPTVTWVGASNLSASVNASIGTKAFTGTDVATGNEQGWFTADSISEGDQVICFSADGYVPVCRTVKFVEGLTTPVPDVLLPTRGAVQTIGVPGTATDPTTGAQIDFLAGDVCQSDGTTVVAGNIDCYLTALNPQNDLDQVPDTFQAVSTANGRGTMVSSSIMSVECEQGGVALQLCTGRTADIKIPIMNTCADNDVNPANLESWRYDATTGLWSQYPTNCAKTCGGGTADVYDCTIDHMTWVNGDVWRNDACLTGTVVGSPSGTGEGRVLVECSGGGWRNTTYTNESGVFCIPVPQNYGYTCRVCDTVRCNGTADNKTGTATGAVVEFPFACPHANCVDIGEFVFARPRVNTTLTWGQDPSDLDSHFVLEGGSTHVYYGDLAKDLAINFDMPDPAKGNLTAAPYIQLDTDDTSSFGPEVTSVMPDVANGTYRFCVRNFSGETSGGLCVSSAKVRVEIPSQGGDSVNVAQTRDVPTSCPSGNNLLWQVYEVTISGGVVTNYRTLDKIVDSDSPTTVPTECFE